MTTLALVEDNKDLREGLKIIFDEHRDEFHCLEMFADGESGMSGIECVRKLRKVLPETDVIMLTVFADDDTVFDSLCAGACGYITKNASPGEILDAVREVKKGGAPMSARIARMVVTSFKGFESDSLRGPAAALQGEKLQDGGRCAVHQPRHRAAPHQEHLPQAAGALRF
jgi:DNA-binding response OmpR family regulator